MDDEERRQLRNQIARSRNYPTVGSDLYRDHVSALLGELERVRAALEGIRTLIRGGAFALADEAARHALAAGSSQEHQPDATEIEQSPTWH